MSTTFGPRTINAYAAFKAGGTLNPWQYQSRPLGDEDVEVKISHCGICGGDIHALHNDSAPFPCVVGHEIIGEVTQAGPAVKRLAVGDRVGVGFNAWACLNKDQARPCRECESGNDAYCKRAVFTSNSKYEDGHQSFGGFADYIRVSSNYAFPIPENIPSDAAAPLMCAGSAVYSPLKREGVKAGDRVGVVGIGGLGHLALQFIRALDATPIAFSTSSKKEEEARTLGAAEFYNLDNPEDVKKAAGSVDLLLVTVAASGLPYNTYLSLVRKLGTLVVLGVPNDDIRFRPMFLVGNGVRIVGNLVGSIEDVADTLKLAAEKNVRPIVENLLMEQVNEGIARVQGGKARYRVVLENCGWPQKELR
ncbi:hypothetical protein L914_14828 [Phytophthora nicotianae]|uniref:Enoyl reductase (ER) domain-containing protein n=2 Tax=Phytophthora nicotianae TaxID=4792 RepID=V9EID2_PHYNI|nr:hypothetical protein F443_15424 [Phytophthora nicotianae P1569]ETM38977.1 hypothetical protein L914_14828 [Phytophthora nicotianae]